MYLFDHYRSLCAYKLECYTLNKPCPKNLNIIIIAIIIIIVIKRRAIQWRMSFPAVWWPNVYEYYIYTRICILCASRPYSLMHEIPSSIYSYSWQKPSPLIYFPLPRALLCLCVVFFRHDKNQNDDGWIGEHTHTHIHIHWTTSNAFSQPNPSKGELNQRTQKKIHHLSWSTTRCCSTGLFAARFACLSKMRSVDGCQECVCVCVDV